MATRGTGNAEGVRVSYSMDFNGVTGRFTDEIIDVSSLSNSGDTISNKRKISDLSWSLYDGLGTIWDEIGHGTEAFGKPVTLNVSVGGNYGYTKGVNGTEFGFLGTDGANDYQVHQGSVVFVSKSNRLINFRSENKLNKVKHLKWQMPVKTNINGPRLGLFTGSYSFYADIAPSETEGFWTGTLLPYCLYNISDDNTSGDMYAHTFSSGIFEANYQGTGLYDFTGTGISDFVANGFEFLDTAFHTQYPAKKFKGTHFSTLIGTIDTEAEALSYGYNDLAEAEASRGASLPDTGTYAINKIRLEYGTEQNPTESRLYESQIIDFTGDPVAIARHCLFGKMVTDYLDDSTDRGNTFSRSQQILAAQTFTQKIDPDETKVEDFINDALQMTSSIFFVNTSNQFEMAAYGPINLQQTLDTFGTNEIFKSSYSNNVNDYYNKVTLKYGWDFNTQEYVKKLTGTQDDWNILNERIFDVETKWVQNDNQANNFVAKILARYKRTSPEMSIDVGLNASGRELGSLISLEDPDSWNGTKIAQIVEYNKDFGGSRKVHLRCLDGDALFRKRGYAVWEDSAAGADVTATAVDNTSRSGWSNGAGVVNGINTDDYGLFFAWW